MVSVKGDEVRFLLQQLWTLSLLYPPTAVRHILIDCSPIFTLYFAAWSKHNTCHTSDEVWHLSYLKHLYRCFTKYRCFKTPVQSTGVGSTSYRWSTCIWSLFAVISSILYWIALLLPSSAWTSIVCFFHHRRLNAFYLMATLMQMSSLWLLT